eukprot:4130986-Amphidinium_carterae.1
MRYSPSLHSVSCILTARSAYRDKAAGSVDADSHGITNNIAAVRAKCRVVLRRYCDPDWTPAVVGVCGTNVFPP